MVFLFLFAVLLSLYRIVTTQAKPENSETNGAQRLEDVIKSPLDDREYRGLKLRNELKVLLISDPKTDKSAASLAVSAGSLNDDRDLPGLAHFLEHMLFLGSKKYPQENEYEKFVTEHAGFANAHTIDKETNFYFDISPDYLVPALDRFAQFFIEPLLNESTAQREVMAVNSEYEQYVNEDEWRLSQLEKSLSKPGHPFNNFAIGNSYCTLFCFYFLFSFSVICLVRREVLSITSRMENTLSIQTGNMESLDTEPKSKGISVCERLLEFHSKWYSANLMNLVVLGKESIDELQKIVIKLFSGVKNKNIQRIISDEHPYGPEELSSKIYVVPVQDVNILNISFPIPDVLDQYKSAPDIYLSHLLGHEGPGSLHSLLLKEELCSDVLLAGPMNEAPGISFFRITINLTEDAVHRIDEIITIVFQYIKLLKTEGIQRWIFDENRKIRKMTFIFEDKYAPLEFVQSLTEAMSDYPLKDILSYDSLTDKWEPENIENLLNYFTPENMNVIIESNYFEGMADQTERWFGTKYKVEKISDELIQKWKDVEHSDKLHLPEPNEFISDNINMYPLMENQPKNPYLLQDSSKLRIWFKQEDPFEIPKLNVQLEIFSPESYLSPSNSNLTEMFVLLVRDALHEYMYAAVIANLEWSIVTTRNGMLLSLSGYNEKLAALLKEFITQIRNPNFDKKRFVVIKEAYIRSLKNFEAEQPNTHASFYLSYLLNEYAWTKSDLHAAAGVLEYGNLEEFVPRLFSKIFIQGLIHGNSDRQNAMDIVNILNLLLEPSSEVSPQLLLPHSEVKINDGAYFSYEVFNYYYSNSCYLVYYQCSTASVLNNIIIDLFLQIVKEPSYTILRTEEQLGYFVQSKIRRFGGVQGFSIIIQSKRHPLYLNYRVENFLQTVQKMLEKITDEELEVYKTSLATLKLQNQEYFKKKLNEYWNEISSQQYNFNRDEQEIQEIKKLKKEDIFEFYKKFLQKSSPNRRKLSVNVLSTETNPEQLESVSDKVIKIEDVTYFRKNLFPPAKPYIQIAPMGTKPE